MQKEWIASALVVARFDTRKVGFPGWPPRIWNPEPRRASLGPPSQLCYATSRVSAILDFNSVTTTSAKISVYGLMDSTLMPQVLLSFALQAAAAEEESAKEYDIKLWARKLSYSGWLSFWVSCAAYQSRLNAQSLDIGAFLNFNRHNINVRIQCTLPSILQKQFSACKHDSDTLLAFYSRFLCYPGAVEPPAIAKSADCAQLLKSRSCTIAPIDGPGYVMSLILLTLT